MRFPEVPLRRLVRIVNGGTPTPQAANWGGTIAWATPVDVGQNHGGEFQATARTITEEGLRSGSAMVPAGSVLVSSRAPIGYVARAAVPMAFNQGCKGLIPRGLVEAHFLAHALQHIGPAMAATGTGTTFQEISGGALAALTIPLPDLAEQRAIAAFLDRETAQIDATVAAQERLVALLEERRRSAIDFAVWQGLDGADVAPSGVDPAPPSPTHWLRVRTKVLFTESQDLSETGDEEMLTVSHLTGVTPRSEKVVNMTEPVSTEGYRLVEPGDLVINTLWAWMGALGTSSHHGIVSPAYGVYRPRSGTQIDSRYFHYLFRSTPYVTEITRHSTGIWSSRLRLYPAAFLALRTVAPPLEEQQRIARFLDDATSRTDTLIARAKESIVLMKERRAALISAAVTGRLDVRTGTEHVERELEVATA